MAGRQFDAAYTDIIKTTSWFWMDTLCIPVGDEFADLRTSAINDMATIYVGASQVLVLDAELLSLSSVHNSENPQIDELDALDALARIAFGTWSRRSWTFQEGALGRECVFQLGDTSVNVTSNWNPAGPRHPSFAGGFVFPQANNIIQLHVFKTLYGKVWHMLQRMNESIVDSAENENDNDLYHPAFPNPSRSFGNFGLFSTSLNKEARHHGELLVRIWNELGVRSTTKSEDLHIIMANLLDFDAGLVMRYPRAHRMRVMLRSIEKIPFSIFYHPGSDVAPAGDNLLRWIPEEPGGHKLQTGQYMDLTSRGLSVPVQDANTISILFPRRRFERRFSTHNKQLRMLLEVENIRLPRGSLPDQAEHRTLLVIPRPKIDGQNLSTSTVVEYSALAHVTSRFVNLAPPSFPSAQDQCHETPSARTSAMKSHPP
ncbi:hypothetical protein K505DRAFT_324016 [Melanomma pulvis-pyrius CBS 109.77]|uniref:Heterokaryon incompatibility domain-containing protein n=1 Tax=Melanomma pulvis-pyrius CBS 109.77 TaxID=1314802 RepID=A0A6A6XGM5_9PLEO|nr:hypothetical protein K505DRAFT_324016 [Melanomma pulvis-pyrius CBS 109.77]